MIEEDRELQKHLVDEMMKVSETNPDVMFYMEALMKKYEDLQQKVEQLEERCEYLERSNNRREDEIIELRDENVDLASKNEQLEKENKELKEENKHIFSKVNDDELLISNAMNYAEAQEYKLKYEQLENIRKEAINKLKEHQYDLDYEPWAIYKIKGSILFELTEILNKGSEQ